MKEEWKPIKTYKSNSTYNVIGDTYYVSNLGRVKLNDIILSIGNGLYMDKICQRVDSYNLKIVGIQKHIYQYVFELFSTEDRKRNYQLHHIDYDRRNNSIYNLLYVSPYEHGKIHSNDHRDNIITQRIHTLHSQYQSLYEHKEEHIDNFKKYLIDRKAELQQSNREERKSLLADKRLIDKQKKTLEHKKERDKKVQSLLDTGNYILRSNGRLYPKTCIKSSESLKRYYSNHPERATQISDKLKTFWTTDKREQFSQKLKSKHKK